MEQIANIIFFTLLAGMAMPLGAAVARYEHIHRRWLENEFRHSVIAFGGGALLSAVALVLVPEGIDHVDIFTAAGSFICGGFAFMGIDRMLARLRTPAGQLTAMLADFIPESLALGAAFAIDSTGAVLLAGLMALQNMPEGFNAYREMRHTVKVRPGRLLGLFALMALLGPIAGVSGYLWLAGNPAVVAAIMLFAAGGILYSIFEDIAPQAVLKKHWAPPMGAVFGFALGIAGNILTR
ncbi:MAG: divalent cation transporter [Pseudomonadales bacterium]|nr:hypothetical protein [Pseudomonadales bacterium]